MNPRNRWALVAPLSHAPRRRIRTHGRLMCATGLVAIVLGPLAADSRLAAQESPATPASGSAPAAGQASRVSPTPPPSSVSDASPRSATIDSAQSSPAGLHQPSGSDAGDPISVAARDYAASGVARTVQEGSSVTYPYGHAQPTLTCAPLRACVIELEAGEVVLSRIAGDTQRWEIAPAVAGPDGRTPLIVVKPHDCGLTTNLVLSTTRGRIYDLTLDSPPCPSRGSRAVGPPNPETPYTRHVRFYYPDDLVAAWTAPAIDPTPATAHGPPIVPASVESFNFSYHVDRDKSFPWTPLAVFDDGAHCYIKTPPSAAHEAAAVLFLVAPDGSKTLLNYALSGDTYITDRVFRRAILVIGMGGREAALRLENREARASEAE